MSSKALEIKYIGAVSLLCRLVSKGRQIQDEDIVLVRAAMNDLLEEFPGRFEIWKVSGGFSLELSPKEKRNASKSA
jgi:ribosomal protein S12